MTVVCNFISSLRAFIVMFAFAMPLVSRAALSLDSPESFFTNVADRLLQQQLGLRLVQVQIAPTNQYDSAVHRIFQVTANIYDATSTNEFPTVFRPLFNVTSNGVFLAGFTNDNSVSTLQSWLDTNPYGIPMVIAARKGIPNFNEFTLRTDFVVTRKLQITRPNTIAGTQPNGTNQMYVLGISNYFGAEAWNSYDVAKAGAYPRGVKIAVSNYATLWLSNSIGLQTNQVLTATSTTNIPSGVWRGGEAGMAFVFPLNTNQVFLSNAVYVFNENRFANIGTNNFEPTPGFPLPYWIFGISNRLTYVMSEQIGGDERIVDFVLLTDNQVVDLYRNLIGINPYAAIGGVSATIAGLWNTNRSRGPNGSTDGIVQQVLISAGDVFAMISSADWNAFSPTSFPIDKNAAISTFRNFLSRSFPGDPPLTNTVTTEMQAPFAPSARLAVLSTWQANDPLVHHHISDLRIGVSAPNYYYLKPNVGVATNIFPSSLGYLNERYSPWGGNPQRTLDPYPFDRAVKDAGVYRSDDWHFPTNEMLSSRWLSRVHRGTPWQTIYLKADAAPFNGWTNQSSDVAIYPNGQIYSRTHPTNDWRLASLLASLLNTIDVRTLTSINTTNFNSWAATLAGLTVLSNTAANPILGQPVPYQTNTITADAPQVVTVIDWLNRWRIANRGEYLTDVAALFPVPQLSSASPWLNLTGDQPKWGITDEAYEILPSQLLSLVRADPVATATRASNSIELIFTAFDGYAFRVESSSDFTTWATVSEPHYSTNGVFTLTLPVGGQPKFFRAVLLP